jgi:hypothetical protein
MILDQETEFHFMVDLETLDTIPSAKITEIGACSIYGTYMFHSHCSDPEGTTSVNTLEWRKAHDLPWQEPAKRVDLVLVELFGWVNGIAGTRKPILWCKGTDFDAAIIKNCAERYGIGDQIPWSYNSVRDLRTLLSLFPEFKVPKESVIHNGLSDALQQAEQLRLIFKQMEL